MRGTETQLLDFLEGTRRNFTIPVYQRNYEWKEENCKQLYDDLIRVIRYDRRTHFFGSVVSVYSTEGRRGDYLVIDGQQRLTTISLLLIAMHNLLEDEKVYAEDQKIKGRIYNRYLVDEYASDDRKLKLKPVKGDRDAFIKLFENNHEELILDSNVTFNYLYFYNRIKQNEISIDDLFEAIQALQIIDIELTGDDNPQSIFESLNSTGLALSEGDKIRNLVLMGLPSKKQEAFYDKYWSRIEKATNQEVSMFIRDYLSVKNSVTPSMNKIYVIFKQYLDEQDMEIETLLQDLLEYANYYKVLLDGNTNSKILNNSVYRLNRLETTVTRPFLLEVLRMHKSNTLLMQDVETIFLTIENYLFRRNICDLPTNSLNKIFLTLHKEVVRYDSTENNYVEKLLFTLINKKERSKFPNNHEFREALSTKQIYLMNSKNKQYLFERFENFGTLEDKEIWAHLDNGDYSIEHIMPQHLTPVWEESLGDDYEEIHEIWLHRLANLTLTAVQNNSKYSNKPFNEKRDMQNGFKDSGLRMNQKLSHQEDWTAVELEQRNEEMLEMAMKIWSYPTTNFIPEEKPLDAYALDDDFNFTGTAVARFSYKEKEYQVNSWTDLYIKMIQILHLQDKTILTRISSIKDPDNDLPGKLGRITENDPGAAKIDDDIFVFTGMDTMYKLSVLRRIFQLYNANPSDLLFYLKSGESEVKKDSIRYQYWDYALPIIREELNDQLFKNTNPRDGSWISGFFGFSGFSIACVTNTKLARVQLYFANDSAIINRNNFEKLFAIRNEIESKLGAELLWDKSSTNKHRKIDIELLDVSIENKNDWEEMAKFQAQWAKKFYEVLVPYITQNKLD